MDATLAERLATHHGAARRGGRCARHRSGTAYLDGTFGRGGHTRRILGRLSRRARRRTRPRSAAIAAAGDDRRSAPERASRPLRPHGRGARRASASPRCTACCSTWASSSPQIDDPGRGFSFRFDGPLDMAWIPSRGESAAYLARADQRQIAEVIRDYGEERFAVPIAKALVTRREGGHAVRTTAELAEIVARAVRTREPGRDPPRAPFRLFDFRQRRTRGTQTRVERGARSCCPGGRPVVISFHSLEGPHRQDVHRAHARRRSTAARRLPSRRRCACTRSGAAGWAADCAQPARALGDHASPSAAPRTIRPPHDPAEPLLLAALLASRPSSCASRYDAGACCRVDKAQAENASLDVDHERLKAEKQSVATPSQVEAVARQQPDAFHDAGGHELRDLRPRASNSGARSERRTDLSDPSSAVPGGPH